jgi:hypothetical protein
MAAVLLLMGLLLLFPAAFHITAVLHREADRRIVSGCFRVYGTASYVLCRKENAPGVAPARREERQYPDQN